MHQNASNIESTNIPVQLPKHIRILGNAILQRCMTRKQFVSLGGGLDIIIVMVVRTNYESSLHYWTSINKEHGKKPEIYKLRL